MKIGIIGLGDIAQKAYLPILAGKGIEVHLYARNNSVLTHISEQYRFTNVHTTFQSILNSGITGAFVHTSTSSHEELVARLLETNIHVYVDKPITYHFASSETLIRLAAQRERLLMVGFNRRYAPAYRSLKEMKNINMILMQKNRQALPGDVRTFIFDDFIHVIDTLLYLFPYPVEKIQIDGMKKGEALYHVVLQLTSREGATAIGIMNRDSGTIEERLEVSSPTEKRVVLNLTDSVNLLNKSEIKEATRDWEGTLHKRGFESIIAAFLRALDSPAPHTFQEEVLSTHKLCEEVVKKLSEPSI